QAPFGADVISRISHGMAGREAIQEPQAAVIATMNSILAELYRETGVTPEQTYEAVVVGNVTMLHLLFGIDPTPLAMAPFTPAFMDQLMVEAGEVGLQIHPHGYIQTLPALGAYVGADIVAGVLDYSGRFKQPEDVPDHPLRDRLIDVDGMRAFLLADGVYLTQRDIRELQFAKGSIATGIKVLMDILGVSADDLDEVLLGGSFGSYLNPESAKVIGLVPPVDVDRIIAVGNSAGEGAKIALLSYRERQVAFELPSRIEYVE